MGEFIPYALARSNGILSPAAKNLKRSVTETIRDQVHITTSGYFTRPPFDCARQVLGLDHLLYSVDYPFSPNTKGRDFLATLQSSDPALTTAELESLTHLNAERLLRL
jgi:predicted TIM-barrel fold metal-dependent hydrolase